MQDSSLVNNILYPVDTAKRWPITSKFGWRIHPLTKKPKLHKGIDLGVPEGTPVFAVSDSNNCYQGSKSIEGLYIILEFVYGSDKYQALYFHLSKVMPTVNDRAVKAGEIIGLTGSSGAVLGAHLHFQLQKLIKGVYQPIDPLAFYNQPAPLS